jgi:hypothetical protein
VQYNVTPPWVLYARGECMAKKPKSIVVVEEGDERYILKTFSDGSEEREPVVKLPRKKRYPPRPYCIGI